MSTYPGLGRGWAVRGSVGGFRAGWGVAANGYKGFFFGERLMGTSANEIIVVAAQL